MANTFTFVADTLPDTEGSKRVEYGTLTWTGTYVNPGGDVLPVSTTGTPTLFRMARLDGIDFLDELTTLGQSISYDRTTRKLKFWQGAAGNATELSNGGTNAGSIRIRAFGVGL